MKNIQINRRKGIRHSPKDYVTHNEVPEVNKMKRLRKILQFLKTIMKMFNARPNKRVSHNSCPISCYSLYEQIGQVLWEKPEEIQHTQNTFEKT